MDFKYRWTNRKRGGYAIRKTDAGKRGTKDFREAGKAIEKTEAGHTSKTHFFLDLDDGTRFIELPKINNILKTVTYNYVWEGTGEKAARQYLTKGDFDKVFGDPKAYENGTLDVGIAPPRTGRLERERAKAATLKLFREYLDIEMGKSGAEKLFALIDGKEAKGREHSKRRKAIKAKILELQNELRAEGKAERADAETADNAIRLLAEKAFAGFGMKLAEDVKAKLEEAAKIQKTLTAKMGKAQKAGTGGVELGKLMKEAKAAMKSGNDAAAAYRTAMDVLEETGGDYAGIVEMLSSAVKADRQRRAGNKRQRGYRAKKKP